MNIHVIIKYLILFSVLIQTYLLYDENIQSSLDYPPPVGLVKMLVDSEGGQ